jgi:hypothetical protein
MLPVYKLVNGIPVLVKNVCEIVLYTNAGEKHSFQTATFEMQESCLIINGKERFEFGTFPENVDHFDVYPMGS